MATYAELNARPAGDFLNPDNFRTVLDTAAGSAKRYTDGLRMGAACLDVSIAVNGTWSARSRDGGHITSYEGIGYHSNTAAFWAGILASGVSVGIYRHEGRKITRHELTIRQAA